jgi:uncharacterized membrane protein YdjX (TVP38/TMEM64 family)
MAIDLGEAHPRRGRALRLVPLFLFGLAVVAALALHPDARATMVWLAGHRAGVAAWVESHATLAALAFGLAYFATKALFVPTGPFLTALGGFLLGTTTTTVVGTAAGALAALVLYVLAELGFGSAMRAKALPVVERLGAGFRQHAALYLIAMRLLPIVPFWLGCFVPALLDVGIGTYLWATLVGSLPSIVVYASLGSGLGALLDQGRLDPSALLAGRFVAPLFGLAALALLPVLYAKLRGRLSAIADAVDRDG